MIRAAARGLLLASLLGASGPAFAQAGAKGTRAQAQARELDPFLWPSLLPAVKAASEAERDPKRGPANGRQILEKEKTRHGSTRLRTSLDLRIAAMSLREHFMASRRFPEVMRRTQALSTYSRLDLGEPGLREALRTALDARREAARAAGKKIDPPKEFRIRASILARTSSIDKKAFQDRLASALSAVGVELVPVAPKEAEFVLKVGAQDAAASEGRRTVTVSLDLEQIEGESVTWRSSSFRTSAAPTSDAAVHAGLDWLARIGGRDLLFRFLADGPLPELAALSPSGAGHEH